VVFINRVSSDPLVEPRLHHHQEGKLWRLATVGVSPRLDQEDQV
jgi:hypothetical protein